MDNSLNENINNNTSLKNYKYYIKYSMKLNPLKNKEKEKSINNDINKNKKKIFYNCYNQRVTKLSFMENEKKQKAMNNTIMQLEKNGIIKFNNNASNKSIRLNINCTQIHEKPTVKNSVNLRDKEKNILKKYQDNKKNLNKSMYENRKINFSDFQNYINVFNKKINASKYYKQKRNSANLNKNRNNFHVRNKSTNDYENNIKQKIISNYSYLLTDTISKSLKNKENSKNPINKNTNEIKKKINFSQEKNSSEKSQNEIKLNENLNYLSRNYKKKCNDLKNSNKIESKKIKMYNISENKKSYYISPDITKITFRESQNERIHTKDNEESKSLYIEFDSNNIKKGDYIKTDNLSPIKNSNYYYTVKTINKNGKNKIRKLGFALNNH